MSKRNEDAKYIGSHGSLIETSFWGLCFQPGNLSEPFNYLHLSHTRLCLYRSAQVMYRAEIRV